MKKKIYRSTVLLEILSDEPIPEDMTLGGLIDEADNGGYSMVHSYKSKDKVLWGIGAVKAIQAQGSDPEFFGMDENGNELINDDYDENRGEGTDELK